MGEGTPASSPVRGSTRGCGGAGAARRGSVEEQGAWGGRWSKGILSLLWTITDASVLLAVVSRLFWLLAAAAAATAALEEESSAESTVTMTPASDVARFSTLSAMLSAVWEDKSKRSIQLHVF